MLSQQRNPAGVSQSLHQQIPSNNNHGEPDMKPFSIRQYALVCRQKDVFSNWPFPEKYLQLCFKHGVNDVLPPLESHNLAFQSLGGVASLNSAEQDDKRVDYFENKLPETIEKEGKDECKLDTEEPTLELSIQHCHLSPSKISHAHAENKNDFSPHVAFNIIVTTDQHSTTIPSSHLNFGQCNKALKPSRKLGHKQKQDKRKHK